MWDCKYQSVQHSSDPVCHDGTSSIQPEVLFLKTLTSPDTSLLLLGWAHVPTQNPVNTTWATGAHGTSNMQAAAHIQRETCQPL